MDINELITKAQESLIGQLDFDGIYTAIVAFDEALSTVPLDKYCLVFNCCQHEAQLYTDETEECCQSNDARVSMTGYAPMNASSEMLYELVRKGCEKLTSDFEGLMTGYKIGKIEVDNDIRVLKIECTLFFKYELCPAYSSESSILRPYSDFLCKTHVNDSTVHVTADEKEKINAPFVCGTYLGTGSELEETIVLGFKPSLVLVYAANSSIIGVDTDRTNVYAGILSQSGSTKGISLHSTGFTVRQADTLVSRGVYPTLNEAGVTYCYAAFK